MTNWEKQWVNSGGVIFDHEEIVEHLLFIFNRDKDDLLLKASLDFTMQKELVFVLDYPNCFRGDTNFGGQVVYNKKKRLFTHIIYSDRSNWMVSFSIVSKAAYFSKDFWKPLTKIQPFWSTKKLKEYLLNN